MRRPAVRGALLPAAAAALAFTALLFSDGSTDSRPSWHGPAAVVAAAAGWGALPAGVLERAGAARGGVRADRFVAAAASPRGRRVIALRRGRRRRPHLLARGDRARGPRRSRIPRPRRAATRDDRAVGARVDRR